MKRFDVIVIGGGHAGCEAAAAVHRMGLRCLLVTQNPAQIGAMSCNPAMGGVGKSHIIREVDAFNGLIGQISDGSAIQYRLLNRSRGPAVQGPRAQIDRESYRTGMQAWFDSNFSSESSVLAGEVVALQQSGDRVTGIETADGTTISAHAVILTTGTFLNGCIYLGPKRIKAGRRGDPASIRLANQLADFDLTFGRLKTGTPPRLFRNSIDWDALPRQDGDVEPVYLAASTQKLHLPQISCRITSTNTRTHDIVRTHQHLSPVGEGKNTGVGVRYCPSIDDKVLRFADRDSHKVYLEPEGLDNPLVYPNGLSTALPESIQEMMIRSMAGCADARIHHFGYAIEYDFVQPHQLTHGLRLRAIQGLWLAGQINGTTGYEEASGQGLIAGINAARDAMNLDEVILDRSQSYIGVMIDDLVCRGVTEPYRVFTSRAEYRLQLRYDKADVRLTEQARGLGLVSDIHWQNFQDRQAHRATWKTFFSTTAAPDDFWKTLPRQSLTYHEAFKRPDFAWDEAIRALRRTDNLPLALGEECRADSLYAGYAKRQERDIQRFHQEENRRLPEDLDYHQIPGLSREACEKLSLHRPDNMGIASRIDGVTIGALLAVMHHVKINDISKPEQHYAPQS